MSDLLKEYQKKRNFNRTAEPRGKARRSAGPKLRYIIQKHAATALHFDLRLELDGVMKSWAVPKGPSLDPSVKRLAMQVEDHPIDYNSFEGTIPKGEYGGGTVMLWDVGSYTTIGKSDDPEAELRAGYRKGDFKFRLQGKRLKGEFVLVRMRRGSPAKPQWLLIKHRDRTASARVDVVEKYQRSVVSRRTMGGIARGSGKSGEMTDDEPQRRIFLLSPAFAGGKRAAMLFNPAAEFPLARRLHRGEGLTLGEAFSFMSGLYFRGKLAYSRRFAPNDASIRVITTNRGLMSPDRYVTVEELKGFGSVEIEADDLRYRTPLTAALRELDPGVDVVLLGSVATGKYLIPLQEELGSRLHFPTEFIGRGDMSRGALLLRAAERGEELLYQPVEDR